MPRAGRETLASGRLGSVVSFFILAGWLTHRYWPQLRRATGRVITPLGRWPLTAFLLHIPVVYLLMAAQEVGWLPVGRWADNGVDLVLVLCVVTTVLLLDARRRCV